MDKSKANENLLILSFKDVTNRLGNQERKLDKLTNAVLSLPESFRKQTEELIEKKVPQMMDDKLNEHKKFCMLNSISQEITRDDIKQRLQKNSDSIIPKTIKKVPRFIWYIIGGILVAIASRYGIDISWPVI